MLLLDNMPPKNAKTGQQPGKTASQGKGANVDTANASKTPLDISNEEIPEAPETPEAPIVPSPTNSDILKEILSLKGDMAKQSTDMLKAINDIKGDIQLHSQRINETEERISQTEDDVSSLQGKVKILEKTVETLCDRITEQEDRSRRSNLRLVGLPEKAEGSDMCGFLEKWLRDIGEDFTMSPIIERAHRIGPINPKSTLPRVVIMKFLNYRDREATLRTARRMTEVRYENQRVAFFPDLSTETRKLQQRFNGVKTQLRALNIRYGMLYPAHLIITHNDKRRIFKSVAEAEEYVQEIRSQTCGDSET